MPTIYLGEDPVLEAVAEGDATRCAVITHPHPLYGGNMHNNVVMTARDAALAAGFSSLRFNFRGVGRSGGVHDEGRGEVQDLATVITQAGSQPILIGYSFGAWIAAAFLTYHPLPCILIAPPTGMFAFPSLQEHTVWAVIGSRDQFCDQQALKNILDADRLTILPGIDHFWFGRERVLYDYLIPILSTQNMPH